MTFAAVTSLASITSIAMAGCLTLPEGKQTRCNDDGSCGDETRCVADRCVPSHRQILTLAAPEQALEDFPLPVWLAVAGAQGNDATASNLQFYDADGNQLAHEIELVDDRQIVAWVRVTLIKSVGMLEPDEHNFIQVDYHERTSKSPAWDRTRYAGVYHFADSAVPTATSIVPYIALGILDSTENGRNGTVTGSSYPARGAGQIGSARAFLGAGAIEVPVPELDTFTISGWFKQSSPAPDLPRMIDSFDTPAERRHTMAARQDAFWLGNSNGRIVLRVQGATVLESPGTVPCDTWFHVAVTVNGPEIILYIDGKDAASSGDRAIPASLHPISLGASRSADALGSLRDFLDGALDEVRIETAVRTKEWIKAEYDSQQDKMISYGEPTPVL